MKIKDLPKVEGHRKRLREKFLQGGLDGFLEETSNQKSKKYGESKK